MKFPSHNAVALNVKSTGGEKAIKIGRLNGFNLAGMSWSEFVAGTLQAQLPEALRICPFAGYLNKYS
jgi:hypothetical protein